MGNPSKTKGTTFERAVVQSAQDAGFRYAERRALSGAADRGDIAGIPGVVLECKATKELAVAAFMAEAERERVNDTSDYGVVIWKRPRQPVEQAAAIIPLWQLWQLLREAGR